MGRWKGKEIYKRWTKICNFQFSTLSRVCLLLKLHTIYYQHLILKSSSKNKCYLLNKPFSLKSDVGDPIKKKNKSQNQNQPTKYFPSIGSKSGTHFGLGLHREHLVRFPVCKSWLPKLPAVCSWASYLTLCFNFFFCKLEENQNSIAFKENAFISYLFKVYL